MKNHLYPSEAVRALEVIEKQEAASAVRPIKAGEDQWVFHLSGTIALALRVSYVVVPRVKPGEYNEDGGREAAEVYGKTEPVLFELFTEPSGKHSAAFLGEYERNLVPNVILDYESRNRPDAEDLGWTRGDLLEVAGSDEP